jgi:hypothetical protein
MYALERRISVKLALYDSARRSEAASHWQWQHRDLHALLLDTLYYELVSPQIHTAVIESAPDAIFAAIDDQWCCWYRVFNAGRDSLGRPGRFLVAAALMRRSDVIEADTTSVLELPFFQEVALSAEQSSPMTSPSETEQIFKVEAVSVDAQTLEQLQRGDVVEFQDQYGLRAAAIACSCVTPPVRWRLDVQSWATEGPVDGQALVSCLPAAMNDRASSNQVRSKNTAASLEPVGGVRQVGALGIMACVVTALAVGVAAFWYHHSRPQMHPPNRSSSQPRVERKVNSPSPRVERPPSRRPGIPSHDSSTRSC